MVSWGGGLTGTAKRVGSLIGTFERQIHMVDFTPCRCRMHGRVMIVVPRVENRTPQCRGYAPPLCQFRVPRLQFWCPVYDLNARPSAYKAAALPTELTGRILLVRRPVLYRHSFFCILFAIRHGSHLHPRRLPVGEPCTIGLILSAAVLAKWHT